MTLLDDHPNGTGRATTRRTGRAAVVACADADVVVVVSVEGETAAGVEAVGAER